jgi:hypothetical protein
MELWSYGDLLTYGNNQETLNNEGSKRDVFKITNMSLFISGMFCSYTAKKQFNLSVPPNKKTPTRWKRRMISL